MHGFCPVYTSSGVILEYLDLASWQNTQRAGHVRLFLISHLPFPIEGYPIHCSYYLNFFSLVAFYGPDLAFRRKEYEVTGDQGALPYCPTPAIPFL